MFKGKKKWFWIGGVVLLIIIVVVASGDGGSGKGYQVTSDTVVKHNITEIVEASGKIQPETEVVISADVSGEIIELMVKEGDKVKQGDLLCKINPDLIESALNRQEAALNQARANLAMSKARLAQAEARFISTEAIYQRTKKLKDQGAVSQQEFETAESNWQVGKADIIAAQETVNGNMYSVRSAEASRKEAADNLGRTSIFAPMDGTVSRLSVEKGERVVGTGQMSGTEIMTIAHLDVMEAEVSVNESNIIRVKMGDTALIEVDAYLGRKFKGLVTEIANSANSGVGGTDQVTNFTVKVRILPKSYSDLMDPDNPHRSPFYPGMSSTVEIRTETAMNVIAVPVESVTTREDTTREVKEEPGQGNQWGPPQPEPEEDPDAEQFICVFVVNNGEAELRVVETGIQDTEFIHIKSGIEAGEEVITGDFEAVSKELMNGSKIRVVETVQRMPGM